MAEWIIAIIGLILVLTGIIAIRKEVRSFTLEAFIWDLVIIALSALILIGIVSAISPRGRLMIIHSDLKVDVKKCHKKLNKAQDKLDKFLKDHPEFIEDKEDSYE